MKPTEPTVTRTGEPTVNRTGDDDGNRAAEIAAEMHAKRADMIEFKRSRHAAKLVAKDVKHTMGGVK